MGAGGWYNALKELRGLDRKRGGVIKVALTVARLPAKKRGLTICVKLFLEREYKKAEQRPASPAV